VLEWNTDKRYLADLAAVGVPSVPTTIVPPGSALTAPDGDYVVKPTISGSAADTGRFDDAADPRAHELVARIHAQGRTVMVQPYLSGIEDDGETSVVFLGGVLSHAVRRAPLLTAPGVRRPVVVADVLGTVGQVEPTDAQRAVAEAALAAVPGGPEGLSYARVDLIPGSAGPVVLELEATDCYLFLGFAQPEAVKRLAEHVVAQGEGQNGTDRASRPLPEARPERMRQNSTASRVISSSPAPADHEPPAGPVSVSRYG
jgi:glutathione synthase/RimK-type ligase-like ATP-grasp enzyme